MEVLRGARRKEHGRGNLRRMGSLPSYAIVRSPKRSKLTITVERDRAVVVHAPEATSDQEISRIVDSKRQ
jgi:predicted metal-dependent hydrolase